MSSRSCAGLFVVSVRSVACETSTPAAANHATAVGGNVVAGGVFVTAVADSLAAEREELRASLRQVEKQPVVDEVVAFADPLLGADAIDEVPRAAGEPARRQRHAALRAVRR